MTVSVVEYLETSAKAFPDKTALTDERSSLTYAQLRTCSYKIAACLLDYGAGSEPVVVFMEKSVQSIASFLGVASSGKFYVPVDVEMPPARINKILETLRPRLAIVTSACREQFVATAFKGEVLVYEECLQCDADEAAVNVAIESIIDTDLLYVLFTSGSTGAPKGVTIRHISVIDYIERLVEVFGFTDRDVFANQAPFYFDNSVLDIYSTLRVGATMHIVPQRLFSFPVRLLEDLNACKATCVFWVPAALIIVANFRALPAVHVPTLNKILFAGEVMPNKQLNQWRAEYPDALFANLYGPTEIAVDCTYYIVDRMFDDSDPLPIGNAFRNSDVLVLGDGDELISPARVGVLGELCVRGSSLSCGYYNNPEKTAEAFVQNPLNSAYPEIIYRTGDLVRYNEYGEIDYVSRKDFQIKRFGHRIELGEIETACAAIPGVDHCCCLFEEKRNDLVVFMTGSVDEESVIGQLKSQLPSYMVPSRVERMRALPMTGSGKIDRVALKASM